MAKIICPAMQEAGITDPESQEGKDFCTDSCPYPFCIVCEGGGYAKTKDRKQTIQVMKEDGGNVVSIAQTLGVSTRTVQRALK